MVTKTIKKEQKRQEIYLKLFNEAVTNEKCKDLTPNEILNNILPEIPCHKESLISMKEYMEEELVEWNWIYSMFNSVGPTNTIRERIAKLKEDISELTKMIGKYGL